MTNDHARAAAHAQADREARIRQTIGAGLGTGIVCGAIELELAVWEEPGLAILLGFVGGALLWLASFALAGALLRRFS